MKNLRNWNNTFTGCIWTTALILFVAPTPAIGLTNPKMKIFVAGGTGVLGQALVPQLVQAGHSVTVATRSKSKLEQFKAMGASPVVCDILNQPRLLVETLVQLQQDAAPFDVVIHQGTALSHPTDPFGETNRLRTVGTQNLIDAARQAKVKKFIAQSVAFFCTTTGPTTTSYRDDDNNQCLLTNEDSPLCKDSHPAIQPVVDALASLEDQVLNLQHDDMQGVVLRYGHFYGPRTFYAADGWISSLVKEGKYPMVIDKVNDGHGGGTYSFISVDDAAAATVQAVTATLQSSGIYTIVDNTPVSLREWLPGLATMLQAPRPVEIEEDAQLMLDPFTHFFMTQQKGASNQKAKSELNWKPTTPDWRQGFAKLLLPEL